MYSNLTTLSYYSKHNRKDPPNIQIDTSAQHESAVSSYAIRSKTLFVNNQHSFKYILIPYFTNSTYTLKFQFYILNQCLLYPFQISGCTHGYVVRWTQDVFYLLRLILTVFLEPIAHNFFHIFKNSKIFSSAKSSFLLEDFP